MGEESSGRGYRCLRALRLLFITGWALGNALLEDREDLQAQEIDTQQHATKKHTRA